MVYKTTRIDNPQGIDVLLEKDPIDQYVSKEDLKTIFSNESKTFNRLRLHYFEVAESNTDRLTDEVETETGQGIESREPHKSQSPQPNSVNAMFSPEIIARNEAVDAVGLYLKEMSRVPLLSNEEEISIAKRIERAKLAKHKLAKLNGRNAVNRREELDQIIEDGRLAREHLIKANTRLVVSIAKKYIGRGVPFLDLIQEGNLGLMKAVNKYDYLRGFRFSTYATWWIRQTITRSIADQGRTIRVPVHMIDRIRQLYKTARKLEQQLGRPPKVEELSEEMEVESRKVQWMLRVSWLPLSLESPIGDDEDSELGMFVEDDNTPTPSQAAYQNMLCQKVNDVLTTLTPREARILRLRFGLENGRTYTLEEVGEKFGLTRERIRQIEGKALRRLRHPMRSRQLREYL
jgi:RNA polymerase primary sigma factor